VARWELLAGAVIAVLTWPFHDLAPQAGLDPSWVIGLSMAAQRGLDFGQEVVFTYGPLGFLDVPSLATIGGFRLATLFQVVLRVALATVLVAGATRAFPRWLAVVFAYLAMLLLVRDDPGIVLAAAAAVLVLRRDGPPPVAVTVALGVLTGIELLAKLSTGVGVLAVLGLALLAVPGRRWRLLAVYAGSTAAVFLICWIAARQGLDALPGYAGHSASVISGYTAAMGIRNPGLNWQFVLVPVAAALLGYGMWLGLRGRPAWTQRLGWLALAAFLFLQFKAGFVRHDEHSRQYFSAILPLIPLSGWYLARRSEVALATLAAAIMVVAASGSSLGDVPSPTAGVSDFVRQANLTVDAGARNDEVTEARQEMQYLYAIDGRLLARAGDAPLTVLPFEIGVAWAHGLNWRPLPVFQDYQAYTPSLDDLNADALASDDGPAKVLRYFDPGVDGRLEVWDPPREKVTLLCHFRQEIAASRWQLLTRVPDRCGAPRRVSVAEVGLGQPLTVPAAPPGTVLVARVLDGVEPGLLERVVGFAYKPRDRFIVVDQKYRYRLVTATAGDGLIVTSPPDADFPIPFRMAPQLRTLSFEVGRGAQPTARRVRVAFDAIPITGLGG
jgi:hypothetical protein